MARRYAKRRSPRRASSSGSLMKGFIKPKGMIAGALLGIGAGIAAQTFLPNQPLARPLAAGLVGGVPGIGGAILLNAFGGTMGNIGTSIEGIWN